MKKVTKSLFIFSLLAGLTVSTYCGHSGSSANAITEPVDHIKPTMEVVAYADRTDPVATNIDIYEEENLMSDQDVELIALIVMAEAEGECEEGKRLVIDTILNRADSEHFPDTISEVIYQPNQFESVWNGRTDRCEVLDYICDLVKEEARNRTNYDVMFFTAGEYGDYGSPMFQVENHYFSSYN